MQDLIVVVVVIGFFGVCLAFVEGCSRILGPGELELDEPTEERGEPALIDADGVGAEGPR